MRPSFLVTALLATTLVVAIANAEDYTAAAPEPRSPQAAASPPTASPSPAPTPSVISPPPPPPTPSVVISSPPPPATASPPPPSPPPPPVIGSPPPAAAAWTPVANVNDKKIQQVAQFAVLTYCLNTGAKLAYVNVVSGQTQPYNGGSNYQLVITVAASGSAGGKTSRYNVFVWGVLGTTNWQLRSFTLIKN